MKNDYFNAKELFDFFKTQAGVDDFKELYKALLAREIGLDEYTDQADELMNEMLDTAYYKNDTIGSFIDENLVDYVHKEFEDADFEIDNWY